MNLLELAGGVIVTGFAGTRLDDATLTALRRVPFAGYVLFARNAETPEQVRSLTDALRKEHVVPPVVAIDQEGGAVMRLRGGVEPMPAMMALGALADVEIAEAAGAALAHDLRRIGCTLDFAPVLDLALDARNTVIGTRAFGTPAELVTRLGGALARGLERGGITPTFKHFPGHGATSFDTHLEAARLDVDGATLRGRDMVPFARCVRDGTALMAAHVAVPAIDGDRPASISRAFLTGIVREEWEFRGVIFTDCMQMDAIAKHVGTVRGVTEAIAAGADCALISHDPELAYEAAQHLAGAVERGELPRERLQAAYDRVQALRARAHAPLALDAPPPHPGIGRRIAREAVTVVRGEARADALSDVAIVFGEGSLAAHAPALEELRLPVDPDEGECERMLVELARSRRRAVILTFRAHRYYRQARAIAEILEVAPDALLVSTAEPYDLEHFPRARHAIAAYGSDDIALAGLADVIFLHAPCVGVLPVAFA